MTTLQIVSDLHIEYQNDDNVDPLTIITPSADILILAGDIGSLYKFNQLFSFIDGLIPHFKHILYVPGNHEYYTPPNQTPLCMQELRDILAKLNDSWTTFNVLDRDSVQIGDICIVGATLWSDIKCELPRFIVRIHQMTTDLYHDMFRRDVAYIEEMVQYCQDKKLRMICVTHHPPTYSILNDHMKPVKKRDKYVSLYASNLDYLLDCDKVDTWVCGHVHSNFDFINDKGCRIIGNQRGKPKDKITDFRDDYVIN
jgi:predicted phosphohydrolase